MRKTLRNFFGNEFTEVIFYPPYFSFIFSVAFSQIAFNMMNIILIFLIFRLTSSVLLVSLLVLTFIVPQIILSFFGGIVADVYHKKPILFHGNLLRAVAVLTLFFNSSSVFVIYIVSFIISVISQFYIPAETPVIPRLVKRENLGAANSIFGIVMFGSVLIGYVLASPVLAIAGESNTFLVLSFLFVASAFSVHFIPQKHLCAVAVEINGGIFSKLKNNVRSEFKKTSSLLSDIDGVAMAFGLLILSQIIILIIASIVPGYAKEILEIPTEKISLYLFSPAVLGTLVASVLIGRVPHHLMNKERMMRIGVFLSGMSIILFPFMSKIISRDIVQLINSYLPKVFLIDIFHLTVFLAFLAGFANALIFIPSQVIIQDKIPEVFRSKFYGLLFGMTGLFSLFPIISVGLIADLFGVSTVLFGIGAFIILIGVANLGFSILNFKNFLKSE